jgi:predicted nucleic acid-binding protein
MSTVFADTYYFVGFTNKQDAAHAACVDFSKLFHGKLVTTEWVLVEYADAMSTTRQHVAVGRYVQELSRQLNVEVIPFSRKLFDQGLGLYISRPDQGWSLTDCLSFVAMREHGLTDALTGDPHFEQAGFRALLK